jgi:hypothetical protein
MLQCSMKLSMRLQFLTLFLLQCAKIRHSTDIPWCFDYAMAQCLPCDLGHHRAFTILQPGPVDLQRDAAAKAVARAINQGGERPMKRFVQGFVVFGCLLCSMLGADTAVAPKSGGILKLYHRDSPASMSILEEGTNSTDKWHDRKPFTAKVHLGHADRQVERKAAS